VAQLFSLGGTALRQFMSLSPSGHDWSLMIHGRCYGLVGDSGFTILHYGFGFVQIPMEIHDVANLGILVFVVLLIIAYVILRRFRKRSA